MTIFFSTGFEDRVEPSVWPGAGGGIYDPEVVDHGDPVTGSWCIAGQTRRTTTNHRRGLYVPLESEDGDFWAGGLGKIAGDNLNHRLMGLFVDGDAVLEVGCLPDTFIEGLWLATDPAPNLNGYVSTNKAAAGNGVFSSNSIWRYLTLWIKRRAEDGDATLFMDGHIVCKLSNYAALGLDKGPITSVSWNNRATSTTNTTHWVYWDDLWAATENNSGARIPALTPDAEGTYTEGEPSVLNAPLDEMVANIPPDTDTYIEVDPDDAVSFTFDDQPLMQLHPRVVDALMFTLHLSGPTSWVVFCRIGGVDYDIEQIDVMVAQPVVKQVSSQLNPATGLAWEPGEIANVEFGVRNGVMA